MPGTAHDVDHLDRPDDDYDERRDIDHAGDDHHHSGHSSGVPVESTPHVYDIAALDDICAIDHHHKHDDLDPHRGGGPLMSDRAPPGFWTAVPPG